MGNFVEVSAGVVLNTMGFLLKKTYIRLKNSEHINLAIICVPYIN